MQVAEQTEIADGSSSPTSAGAAEGSATPSPTPEKPNTNVEPASEADALSSQIGELRHAIAELRGAFVERLLYDAAKEKAFDRLYADLEHARSDSEFERLRPLFVDLILLFDRVDKAANEVMLRDASAEDTRSLLPSLREELLEILNRRGIELIEPSPKVFDPTLQRVVAIQAADTGDEENAVAAIVRRGFRKERRLIRAEEVIVRKLQRLVSAEASHESRASSSSADESATRQQ